MAIDVGYAWRELIEAQRTSKDHADPEVRKRAEEKVAKWQATIEGMRSGKIQVGSRTPTKAPAWVTLDVVTGGFATGMNKAGGPLLPHEVALAKRLGLPAERKALNLHFLTAPETFELLGSGGYRIEVPEEGALLAVAWLVGRGETERAGRIVEEISPWFSELRFYPVPAEEPLRQGETVRLQDVSLTRAQLDDPTPHRRLEQMREALLTWTPLGDRVLELVYATIEGEPPRLAEGSGGKIVGGEVLRHFPDGWGPEVKRLVQARGRVGKAVTARAKEISARIGLLARCADDPASLSSRERHSLRLALARHLTAHGAHGAIGSAEHAAWRAANARAVEAPLHGDLRRVVVDRLVTYPLDGGLELATAAAPISAEEAELYGVRAGSELPGSIVDKLARSWDAPLDELAKRGVLPSSEKLAAVLPQLTSWVRAEALEDERARRLYVALYGAFRRRRGLLLLNYQHQVRFQELPWAAALDEARVADEHAAKRAHAVVAHASAIALREFPQTILPNKLVTELTALVSAAELELPLVEELAADIFMGSFTPKFARAARTAGALLSGTLYQRYYDISAHELTSLANSNSGASQLAGLSATRAASINGKAGYGVAANGKIIEQSQILTTHNLAVLFDAFPLRALLAADLRRLAETCFRWVLRQLSIPFTSGHTLLIRLKNTAYAWRQMIFFASFLGDEGVDFAGWARRQLDGRPAGLRRRFEPAVRGLELAASGLRSSSPKFAAGGGRVFVGWSTERHWLSPAT